MRKQLLLWLLVSWIAPLNAQYFIAGQEPFSVRWQEQRTTYGKILYPAQSDTIAFYLNGYMEYAWRHVPLSLGHSPKPIPLVVHPNSVLSNGFVTWGPRRMEIVSQHDFNASPEPWLLTLSLHENRHVVQTDKLNRGIFRAATYLLGDQGIAPAVGLVPLWFLEGDAVYTETNLSSGGRGRQSSFYQPFRTHLLQHGRSIYPYDKWLMGSYKNAIPNHYQFGYMMVGYGYLKYESDIWKSSLEYVTKRPYTLFPFYFSLKKETGLSRKELFQSALHYLDSVWNEGQSRGKVNENQPLVEHKGSQYCEYRYPQMLNDTLLIALKKTLSRPNAIVAVDLKTGRERIVYRPGIIVGRVSFCQGAALWSEYRPHYRWENLNYSEIWKYDFIKKKALRITSFSRFFNPVQMNNGTILAIEYGFTGPSRIVALSPYGHPVAYCSLHPTLEPKEIAAGYENEFYVRASSPKGALILRFPSIDSTPDTILGPLFRDISGICLANDHIFFSMTSNGVEDLFAIGTKSHEILQIGCSEYGLTQPSGYKNRIVASTWSATGLFPVQLTPEKNEASWIMEKDSPGLFKEGQDNIKTNYTAGEIAAYESYSQPYPYSNIKGLFNFHSWAPFYFNPFSFMEGSLNVYPGLSAFSQNVTSTMAASLGYSYNEIHGLHAHIHWLGWYPVVSLGVDIGNTLPKIVEGPYADEAEKHREDYSLKMNFKLSFPVNLSRGNVVTRLNLGFKYSSNNTWLWDYKTERYDKWFDQLETFFTFYSAGRMAHRDLRPKTGIYFYTGYTHSPTLSHLKGDNIVFLSELYLPGFATSHSIMITGKREKEWVAGYFFNSRLKFPRGYDNAVNQGFSMLSLDYALPLIYPDLAIGPVVYLKRLFANFFFDKAHVNGYRRIEGRLIPHSYQLSSVGVDLYSDANYFRTRYELRMGYRFGVTLDKREYFHEFLVSLNPGLVFGHTPDCPFKFFNF
ncbi:MAG TPA: hypothetical protein PLO02_09220 [Tenuifilaceae bacterium]|jgi:hypothetical protein|nr:hypothetical protein [Bacteroidota bacterium]MZP81187.1 hypothetical protein [Bacteroidales bacterium]NLH57451.1 hypothetical protein [Rikenellaceae bacterium]OQC65008.1 MAG: hypothetical protein BWX49_00226 [Bacteroidetes bacterium ADurb.Bin008]HNV82009.1 hypothetical protein [Tenuifilaceae bacterium]